MPDQAESWWTYILECADGSLYTGSTNNLEKRIAAHNSGKASKYTRSHLPVRLCYSEAYSAHSGALQREWEIKKLPRPKKLALIAAQKN